MQVHDHAGVVLFRIHDLFVVSVAQECQYHTVSAQRRLDALWGCNARWFPGQSIPGFAGVLCCGGTGRSWCGLQCPTARPSRTGRGIQSRWLLWSRRKALLFMVAQAQVFVGHAQIKQPFVAEVLPVLEPFKVGVRFAEEFQLHLLKFAGTEGKVSGSDLVTEGSYRPGDTRKAAFCGWCAEYWQSLQRYPVRFPGADRSVSWHPR